MESIPLFNPYTMSDDEVLKLQTAHETDLKKILSVIQNNQRVSVSKHIVICGHQGIGKSFLLRRLQIHFKHYNTIVFFLFPEIPAHMYCANDFLKHIQQFLLCNNKSSQAYANNWKDSIQIIDQLIKKSPYKHMIIGIENLHLMLSEQGIFSNSDQRKEFQNLLQKKSWLTLITTHNEKTIHNHASFFESFYRYDMSEWTELEYDQYLNKIFSMYHDSDTELPIIKKKALRFFTGGMPRNAIIMAEILKHKDIYSSINALETSIDWLTPYYQYQFFSLMPRSRLIIDALICDKEPCQISRLANRLHLNEKDITNHVCKLMDNGFLNKITKENKKVAYLVKDRLFVQYYRMRHERFPFQCQKSNLSVMGEFLTTFYDHQDLKQKAQDCFSHGNSVFAKELLHIILSHAGISIERLPWGEDLMNLFQAVDICSSHSFQLPNSEKKGAIIHQQMRILLKASYNIPNNMNTSRLAHQITGNLFLNEKQRRFLFLKCMANQFSYNQWVDLDLFFIRQEFKMNRAYGDFLIPLNKQMFNDEIIPDIMRKARMDRLKQSDPDIFHALIAFCIQRLPFTISSTDQLEAHRKCLKKTKDFEFQVYHLEQIGWHLGCLKLYNEAIVYFQKALLIREKQNDVLKQAWISGQIAWCYQLMKEYDLSLKLHEKSCKIYQNSNDHINYAWNIGCIGRIHGKKGQHKAAIKKHQEAINLLAQDHDTKQIAWNWSRIARNNTSLKRYDLAMHAHQTALEFLENDCDNELKASNLEGLAWIYGKVDQHDDAIKAQQQALKLRSQEGNISQQAWNLEGIGWNLGKLGRFEEALKVLNRALKVREKTNHQKGQAWNLEGIARFLGCLGRFDESIAAHERALIVQKRENNDERQIWNYRGIAWNFKEMNEYDKSLGALKQGLRCAEKSGNIYWQAVIWALTGWNLHQVHRLADSIKAHEMAISFYKTLNNDAGVMENAGQMAINYFILGQTGRAWNVLDHYGESAQCPNKMTARIGEVVIYLIRNVRKSMAYQTAISIIDGLLLRQKQWEISPILQVLLISLIMVDLDIQFINRLVRYIKKRYPYDSNSKLQAIFDLIELIIQNWRTEYLNQLETKRRQAVELLIDAIRAAN